MSPENPAAFIGADKRDKDRRDWKFFIPNVVVAVVMFGVLPTFKTLGDDFRLWLRDPDDAREVEGWIAVAQALFAILLIVLTWYSAKVARDVAEKARTQSREEAREARRQSEAVRRDAQTALREQREHAQRAIQPAMTLESPKFKDRGLRELSIDIRNAGLGTAVAVNATFSEPVVPRKLQEAGSYWTLSPGDKQTVTLETSEEVPTVEPAAPDIHGYVTIGLLTVVCWDLYGRPIFHRSTLGLRGTYDLRVRPVFDWTPTEEEFAYFTM